MADRALVLYANRNGYALLPDNDQWTNRFEVKSSSSSKLYTVAQNKKTREWACACPAWKMKKAGKERNCTHLKTMLPALSCIGVQPEKPAAPAVRIAR